MPNKWIMKREPHKPLDIVFLDFDDIKNPLLAAGQARATVEVGSRLVAMGNKVTVLCSRYPGYKDRTESGLSYKHIGLGSKNIRLNNLIYIVALPWAVRRVTADIIVECFTAPISTLFSPLFTKIPVVAMPTSFEADRFSTLYHLPLDRIERFGLRFYKYFMPYTTHLEEKMRAVNPTVITRVIPEGVGPEFFAIKQKSPKYILFLGRLDMGQKGIDLLLHAYATVKSTIPYPLVIAGNGPDEEKIRQLISELDIGDKVTMIGATYGKKKAKVLAEALYVAFPSRHEGFSLFSLEALASGLPLIAFDIPSLGWTNKSISVKAKPFSVDAYAAILKRYADTTVTAPMRKAARTVAKQYTWDSVALAMTDFFAEILSYEAKRHISPKTFAAKPSEARI